MNNSVSYGASNHSVNHSFIIQHTYFLFRDTDCELYKTRTSCCSLTLIDFPALRLNRCVAMRINLRRWNRAFA